MFGDQSAGGNLGAETPLPKPALEKSPKAVASWCKMDIYAAFTGAPRTDNAFFHWPGVPLQQQF